MWVAQDPASLRVLEQAESLAITQDPVLIHGEPGTGKKLLATLLHELSNPSAPLIYFSPESLPAELIETELFGEETSGYVQRGRLELAQGGTLVLEELAMLPPSAQARLLRVIEEHHFQRPGGTRNVSANVRVIAATVLSPDQAQRNGAIRGDLLAHFHAASLSVPALRERAADVPELANRFLEAWCMLHGRAKKTLSPDVVTALQAYSFAGNISELKQTVEQMAARAAGLEIGPDVLPAHVTENALRPDGARSLEDMEREHIAKVLMFTKGRKTEAADILGISRKTLLEKRKRYGLG